MTDQHTDSVARPWWWNDPETKAWIASGTCRCRVCERDRRLIEEANRGR